MGKKPGNRTTMKIETAATANPAMRRGRKAKPRPYASQPGGGCWLAPIGLLRHVPHILRIPGHPISQIVYLPLAPLDQFIERRPIALQESIE